MPEASPQSRRLFLTAGGVLAASAAVSHPLAASASTPAAATAAVPTIDLPVIIPDAAGDGVTDDTTAIQDAIELAVDRTAAVGLPPGIYAVRSLILTGQVRVIGLGGGMTRFPRRGHVGGVMIVPLAGGGTGPLITIDAQGTGTHLEDVVIDGFNPVVPAGATATDPTTWAHRTGLSVAGGIEVELKDVRVSRFVGTGIEIVQLNNSRWSNVYVDDCGSETQPAMTIGSPSTGVTNYDVFDGLTIERSRNTALAIAAGDDPITDFASNLTFIGLHAEASHDTTVSYLNTSPLIDIGNVRAITFIDLKLLGSPVPLVAYHQRVAPQALRPGSPGGDPGDEKGGVFLIGGHLKQHAGANPTPRSATMLVSGNGSLFGATNVMFASLVTVGVLLDASYQGGASIVGCSFQNGGSTQEPAVVDQRAPLYRNFAATNTYGDTVVVGGRLRTRGSVTAVGTHFTAQAGSTTVASWTRPGIHGTDVAGAVNVVVKKATTSLATVVFDSPFLYPPVVTLTPATSATAVLGLYATVSADAKSFTVHSAHAATPSSTPLAFTYLIVGVG